MKVYDTDEKAVAAGARKQMLARVIQTLIMLAFSAFGIWVFYTLVLAPKKTTGMAPVPVVAFSPQAASHVLPSSLACDGASVKILPAFAGQRQWLVRQPLPQVINI